MTASGSRPWRAVLTSTVSAITLAAAATGLAQAIPYRDDVGDEGAQEFAAGWDGVVQIFLWDQSTGSIFFNCTGSLVNARTVLTAAHCLNDQSSEAYGFGSDFVPIIAYGPDTFVPLLNWIGTGQQFVDSRNGLTFGVDAIIHPDGAVDGFGFPASDVAMIALEAPLYTLPTYGMLFSPIPTEVFEDGVLVNQIGYGTFHAGSTDIGSINGKRRAGENMLGLLASQSDFFQALAQNEAAGDPSVDGNQLLYWTDFDLPGRTGICTRGPDPLSIGRDNSITCDDWDGFSGVVMDGDTEIFPGPSIDYFPGDALQNEVGTAGGDSGGPLMAMNLYGQPLILGVLSGGFLGGFFQASGQVYGDLSYYNPLFSVHDFISENNPYKYVSAVAGNGVWSDPTHWVQTMDPNYFIYQDGEVVNGLPSTPEEGVDGRRPIEGIVFDTPVGEYDTGDDAAAAGSQAAIGDSSAFDAAGDDKASGRVSVMDEGPVTTDLTASGQIADASDRLADAAGRGVAGQAENGGSYGIAAGPGSTGFVPNNDFGTPGTEFANPAQFFEVTLDAAGTTTLDMDAVIDKLNVRGAGAVLDIDENRELVSWINAEVFDGQLNVDGLLFTREVVLWGGELTGSGEITLVELNLLLGNGTFQPGTLFNIAGAVNPGPSGGIGTLSLNGDYVQSSAGLLVIQYDGSSNDVLSVLGNASLGGGVGFAPVGGTLPRYGDSFTFLDVSGSLIGEFDAVLDMPGVLTPTVTIAGGQAAFTLEAADFSTVTSFTNHFQANLAAALDDARGTDYDALSDLYGPLDLLGGDTLNQALDALSPYEAVLFDRSVRGHVDALNGALADQLGGRFSSAQADLTVALASAERHANGMADTQSMSGAKTLFRNVFDRNDESGEPGFRVFGDIGLIHSRSALIYGAGEADVNGHFTLLGAEANFAPGWSGGLAIGLASSESETPASLGRISARAETTQFSLFGSYRGERWHLAGYANTAELDAEGERTIVLGGASLPSGADMDGSASGAGLAAHYNVALGEGTRLVPTASLDYTSFEFDAFSTRAGNASLDVAEREVESLVGRLGTTLEIDAGQWRPMVYLGVAQEFGDGGETYNAVFSDAPSVAFGTDGGMSLDAFWLEASFGLERAFNNGSMLSLAFQTVGNRDYLGQQTATLSYSLPF